MRGANDKVLDEHSNINSPIHPLTMTEFIPHVLVPEASIRLVMEDQSWTGDQPVHRPAWKTRCSFNGFGVCDHMSAYSSMYRNYSKDGKQSDVAKYPPLHEPAGSFTGSSTAG